MPEVPSTKRRASWVARAAVLLPIVLTAALWLSPPLSHPMPPGESTTVPLPSRVADFSSPGSEQAMPEDGGEGASSSDDDPAGCHAARDCVECLTGGRAGSYGSCWWCSSIAKCHATVATRAKPAACVDDERVACPASLHYGIAVPSVAAGPGIRRGASLPGRLRVLHVAIRKGGPEALIQLHLALSEEGFNTSLDTRHSKKEKGGDVMPFFKDAYKEPFSRAPPLRWYKDYAAWMDSVAEGDVMIATETWSCRNDHSYFRSRRGRQMQWHLTVWPKRPRTSCTIASHTHFIATGYMAHSEHSVLFPYISPHIVAHAKRRWGAWRDAKSTLVMYDGDTLLSDKDLKPLQGSGLADVNGALTVRKATGMLPSELYSMYERMKVAVDLKLPGAERFVYEGALFDACVIVDRVDNGADPFDLPIPDRFRVPPNNLPALHARIAECLLNYSAVVHEFAPLRQQVLNQHVTFRRHVRRYFSNSVHIVTRVVSEADWAAVPIWIATTLLQVPFATLEVTVSNALAAAKGMSSTSLATFPFAGLLGKDASAVLADNSYLAAVVVTTFEDPAVASASGWWALLPAPATSVSRVAFVAWMNATDVVASADIVHLFATAATTVSRRHTHNEGAASSVTAEPGCDVLTHSGIVFVETRWYYSSSAAMLQSACRRRHTARRVADVFHPTHGLQPGGGGGGAAINGPPPVAVAAASMPLALKSYLCSHRIVSGEHYLHASFCSAA